LKLFRKCKLWTTLYWCSSCSYICY